MDERNIDLHGAIPDTPDMCRDAVLQAVRTCQEGKRMWRPAKMILAAALAVTLLCGTAFAIANYYSVRDDVADGKPSAAFEQHIVPLEKAASSGGLTFTLGDAVFDGSRLAFTLDISAAEDAKPVYVYPALQAFCGETEIDADCQGAVQFSPAGSLIPAPGANAFTGGGMGIKANVAPADVTGDVTWRYTLRLYEPLGEVVEARDWRDEEETYDEWEDSLRTLHADGKIGCLNGGSITDWLNAVLDPEAAGGTAQALEATGLFSLADTLVFEFTTALPQSTPCAAGQVFAFDGYTVTVVSVSESFMRVDYTLSVAFEQPQRHEHDVVQWYDLSDQDGTPLTSAGATLTLSEDKLSCTVIGSVERISDTPLTALTFVLKESSWSGEGDIPTFTVQIAK